jgi:thermitase
MKTISMVAGLIFASTLTAQADDLLIKVASPISTKQTARYFSAQGLKAQPLTETWLRIQGSVKQEQFQKFTESGSVIYVQKNYKIKLRENASFQKSLRALLETNPDLVDEPVSSAPGLDNPAIPAAPADSAGGDPLFAKQWGMKDIGVETAWQINRGNKIIVAVIDTGVDYTHEDLLPNMWRNTKEIPDNNIDDDSNGYVDDIVGWDFLSKDNKPYDLAATSLGDLLNGGNPGHGTHCAGNVAARGQNGKGISGVAPNAQIMALRFIGNEGGTTADAVLAIQYAVDNGAKVLSNSWGSEGEDPDDAANNLALKESIKYAADHDVLFIAAAGNGHQGAGYDNDTDAKPGVPASYDHDNIISVAAIDVNNNFGSFSNWGRNTVDIAAPGVKVFSTTVSGKYSDTVIPILGANWDGTSMACPHVAGAAALYWSVHPEKTYKQVKDAILNSAVKIPAATGKLVSEGKLNVESLMKQ